MLTLYTTPVVYLYMDRFRIRAEQRRARREGRARPANAAE
jgi:multidrug efflux pump